MTEFFAVLFAILCVDVAYRICAASARDWKHSKSYCRKRCAQMPRWRRVPGLYPDGDCKAPYHLRKYQRLRRLNLILAVPLLLLCYILPLWIASCSAFVYMTAMMVPGMADDIHMKRASKCWFGRPQQYVDYSTFPRP